MVGKANLQRAGMALLVVVVLTMLIALGAYRYTFYMESQYRLTRLHEEQVHAKLAALSGIELAASIAELPSSDRANVIGLADSSLMRHVAVSANGGDTREDQPDSRWRFSLIAASAGSSSENNGASDRVLSSATNSNDEVSNFRFGLENESSKIHLPSLLEWDRRFPGHARATLLALPGATEPLVDAWLRGLGVTSRRNANGGSSLLERLEAGRETKDAKSQTNQLRSMWYGGDLNQNYRLDPLELRIAEQMFAQQSSSASTSSASLSATSGLESASLPPAWQRYVTWHSGQRNETRAGQPRINLNEVNLPSLHQKLIAVWPSDWANFVIAMRQYGPAPAPAPAPASAGGTAPAVTESTSPDFSKPASYSFKSPLDLVGAVVQVPVTNPQPPADGRSNVTSKPIRNPFSSDLSEIRNYLGRVLDTATTDSSPFTTGRIDVSEAPAVVIASVPGIDLALAQRIVQQRASNSGSSANEPRDTIAWLLDGGLVDIAKLKAVEPYLSSRNDVYTVQSIGYRDSLSPVYRCTVTIDARQIPAQIRHHQIWHPWDRGFSMDQLHSSTP